jgi:hypothetical protein
VAPNLYQAQLNRGIRAALRKATAGAQKFQQIGLQISGNKDTPIAPMKLIGTIRYFTTDKAYPDFFEGMVKGKYLNEFAMRKLVK